MKVVIEDEEESISDSNHVTADAFSHASSSHRENLGVIFTSKKLEKLEELVEAINNLKIDDARYELNTATASETQGDLTSNQDTVTHTSNLIEVSVLPTPTNLAIRLMTQMLLTPEVKEIFLDTTPVNAWNNMNLQIIIRTGIYGSIPISTPIHSGIIKSPNPDSSDSTRTRGTRTRIPTGTNAPPCALNMSPNIGDVRQSSTPDLIKSNRLGTSIDGQFTNNLVASPIFN